MRLNFISQKKDDEQKDFYTNLSKNLNAAKDLLKFASTSAVERPREIVKEGLVISYKPSGEYTIKLGHKSNIVVTGIAKQEKEFNAQIRNALSYLGNKNPEIKAELRRIESAKSEGMVYKDIDKCRDCAWYESDTSHETYRDKCKNCQHANLGGDMDLFFPKSQQIVVFTPKWEQKGDLAPKSSFQGTMSLLDAHKKGSHSEMLPIHMAKEILASLEAKNTPLSPLSMGTAMFKYLQANKLNFQEVGKDIVNVMERTSGIQMHTHDGNGKVRFAVDKNELMQKESKKQEKVMGAPSPVQEKKLEEYETKATKDAYPKSKDIMPKGKFSGTLCVAEVK